MGGLHSFYSCVICPVPLLALEMLTGQTRRHERPSIWSTYTYRTPCPATPQVL